MLNLMRLDDMDYMYHNSLNEIQNQILIRHFYQRQHQWFYAIYIMNEYKNKNEVYTP